MYVPPYQRGGPGYENTDSGKAPMGMGAASSAAGGPRQHRFSPYVDNGGGCVAVAGDDYCVLAADTRMSEGYSILTRDSPKCVKLTDKTVLGSAGQQAERATLHKTLQERLRVYKYTHGTELSTPSIAQMLSNTLYGRRFFPFYTFNIVAGLDEEGKGAVYGYDAVGSYQRSVYIAEGSATSLLQPVLDNQVGCATGAKDGFATKPTVKHTAEEMVDLIKDAFTSAGERDIYTGDFVDIYVVTKDGTTHEKFELKMD